MKVPEPRRLPSGSWFIQLRLAGQSIPVTAATKTECIHQAELIKAEHRAGRRVAKKTQNEITLKELQRAYIDRYKATLSPATIRGYEICLKNRFRAFLGKTLSEIPWQSMIDAELKICREKTVKNAWGLVHAALQDLKYPIPDVKLAKVPVNEISFLQPEEILPFIQKIRGRPYEIAALLELHGLRLSEARGLTWDNVDLDREIITVKGARVPGPDGSDVMKQTNKNASSTRQVPIMIPRLKEALEEVQCREGYVVKQSSVALLADIKRACRMAGITEVTNHGLRHSFASLGYHLGLSERQLMQWGGWSDYQTMHKIYIRLAAAAETEARKKMSKFFANENANENSESTGK